MKAVIQRVNAASVRVEGAITGRIEAGLLVLLGVGPEDGPAQVAWLADKLCELRIFPDEAGKMNRSLREIAGGMLVVSQFTLYGDCSRGRRPSFIGAAPPALAEPLYRSFCEAVEARGISPVGRGVFGAEMQVELVNDGPVTLVIESPQLSGGGQGR
jgi:D-aminoacyl-tRNA deacylase